MPLYDVVEAATIEITTPLITVGEIACLVDDFARDNVASDHHAGELVVAPVPAHKLVAPYVKFALLAWRRDDFAVLRYEEKLNAIMGRAEGDPGPFDIFGAHPIATDCNCRLGWPVAVEHVELRQHGPNFADVGR